MLNLIFSFFPKGFDFLFDYENIECVAYDKSNAVSSKIIIPSSEIFFNISLTKIFIKALDLEVEIEDLSKCESILDQFKELAKDKFKVAEIILEPCYKEIKKTLQKVEKKIDEATENIQKKDDKIPEKNYQESNDGPKNNITRQYYQSQKQNPENNTLRNKNIVYQDAALTNKNIVTNQNYAVPKNTITQSTSKNIPKQPINNSIRMAQNQIPYNNINNNQGNYMVSYEKSSHGSQYSGYNVNNNLKNYSNVNYSVTPGMQQNQVYEVNVNALESNPFGGYKYGDIVSNVNYIK